MEQTAIVGFGCAGYHAVKTMREKGYRGALHVFCDTPDSPANPMLTTYYASGKIPEEALFPFGPLEKIAQQYGLTVHCGTAVTKVDSAQKTLLLQDGQCLGFDQILIATGASALVPPIPGLQNERVLCMRSVRDARLLKARLDEEKIRSVAIVGASMVGIKLAELFSDRAIDCTLVDMAPHLFPTAATPAIAALLEDMVRQRGIHTKFSAALTEVAQTASGLEARFGDESVLDCDLLLLCIGTRANTGILDAGVTVRRGVVVDEHMQTSAPGIYAAGDCCEGNNLLCGETQIIGLWDNAARQGKTAGANMAGEAALYPGNILHNITHFMNMDFIGIGDNRATGAHFYLSDASRRLYLEVTTNEREIACINLLNHYKIGGVLKNYLMKSISGENKPLGNIQRARLLREGIPANFIELLEGLKQQNGIGN